MSRTMKQISEELRMRNDCSKTTKMSSSSQLRAARTKAINALMDFEEASLNVPLLDIKDIELKVNQCIRILESIRIS